MPRLQSTLAFVLVVVATACGSSSDSTNPSNNNNGGNAGGDRTMTATYNGVAFKPTLLTSAYLGGQVSVSANDGVRSLLIRGINVNAIGAYSVAAGNANSALVEWIDGVGDYTSLASGGGGSVTFTFLQLGRVAGSFTTTTKVIGGTGATANPIVIAGTFDIKFP
jgi:hypothetical protein